MSGNDDRFYLGIGSVFTESVTSRLGATGDRYIGKLLESKPSNWSQIVRHLRDDNLVGVVVKLRGSDYSRLLHSEYRAVAEQMLEAIGNVPHLVLAHEAVAGPPLVVEEQVSAKDDWDEWLDTYDGGDWSDRVAREHFGDMDPAIQAQVHELMEQHGVTVTTYKRNAEASILAMDFIGDLQDNLLFRLYVPAGRMYEDELGRLLSLFHHWLGAVKGATVRQGGYATPNGRVIEFYGDAAGSGTGMVAELAEFNEFLGLLDDPESARAMLVALGVDAARVDDLVARYARDARRVMLDARHERDRKPLLVNQALEAELADEDLPLSSDQLNQMVQALVPSPSLSLRPASLQSPGAPPAVVIQTQYFERVEGVVAQTLNAQVHYGTPLDDLLTIIRASDAVDRSTLEDDAKQLADPGAPTSTRIAARQRLKAFLFRNLGRVEATTYDAVMEWIKGQLGG